jgi:hypothetical protein
MSLERRIMDVLSISCARTLLILKLMSPDLTKSLKFVIIFKDFVRIKYKKKW